MARTKSRSPFRDAAEKTYRHGVDVAVPGTGLGHQDTEMREWCERNATAWACFGAGDDVRFYFGDAETAEVFRSVHGGRLWSLEGLTDRQILSSSVREKMRLYSTENGAGGIT
ncbi:hypothetical protein [Nisaea sp.]|uniref:hypothetical protein n=1 Tax=Nisaea sp. TaxID=2024842 RepID=UPI003297902D